MKKVILSYIMFAIYFSVSGQDSSIDSGTDAIGNVVDNSLHFTGWSDQNKYWYYRYRLVNGFLIRGEENPIVCDSAKATGYSIPAGNSLYDVDGVHMDLDWGDGTSYLGWYIGVLATEYKLLSNNGQPTDATKRELYFAMKAYERLDRKAETLFYPFLANADCSVNYLDGLFVRDDVSEVLLKDHPEFSNKFITDDDKLIFNSDYHKYRDKDHSETFDINDYHKSNIYPTQDQISDLFMGFALVKTCLGGESYQGYNFTEQAKNYTRAIVGRLENDDWLGKFANPERQIYTNGTNIRDEFNAYGIARAAEWITGESHTRNLEIYAEPAWSLLGDPILGTAVMSATYNGVSITISYLGFTKNLVNTEPKDWTTALQQTLAATGHSWELGIKPVEVDYNVSVFNPFCWCDQDVTIGKCVAYKIEIPGLPVVVPPPVCVPFPLTELPNLPTIKVNVTEHQLSLYGVLFGQEIYALLHEYLHGQRTAILSTTYADIIKQAPCEGPQHKPYTNPDFEGTNGWRGINRWERPLSADGTIDVDHQEGKGSFNGLDYMLLYNLYLLTRGKSDTDYKNLLSLSSSNTIDRSNYWGYESLELSGVVQNNLAPDTRVDISANNSVVLKPGFKAAAGANILIHLGNLNACNTNSENGASARMATTLSASKSADEIKQDILKDLTAKIQSKLDSVSILYSQNVARQKAYTSMDEYLTQNVHEDEVDIEKVILFPNPTNDVFMLEINLKHMQKIKIIMSDIYDNTKVTLFHGDLHAGSNKLTFDIKNFNTGVFNVEIKGSEFNAMKRLVKLK